MQNPCIKTLPDTTALILAGGAGRRVGGVDKGLLPFENMPLVEHVVRRLRGEVATLLISCNRNLDVYAALADDIVTDQRPDFAGPLAGIEAAIPLVHSGFLLLAPCDTPRLPANLGARLLAALSDDSSAGISYAHDGVRDQYLCAMLRRQVLGTLSEALEGGTRAVRHWYGRHRCVPVDFTRQHSCFANINQLDSV